jgi:protein required for attachment to host cells
MNRAGTWGKMRVVPQRRSLTMRMPKRLLIALADGEHARFVRPDPEQGLQNDASIASFTAHKRSADPGSDRPSASFHSEAVAHHAVAPRRDPHTLEKETFAQALARRLNEAAANDAFETLVIVAPTRTLNAIRGGLDRATGMRVIGALAKDLVKAPNHELVQHLHPWVRPIHRVTPHEARARRRQA